MDIIVSAHDDADLPRLADALRACGMQVDQVLHAVGVLTGSADLDALDALRQVAGVKAVEQDREIHISPPDADVQ